MMSIKIMFVTVSMVLMFLGSVTGRVLNDAEKKEALSMHNLVRRSVYPPASNMNELEYSDELAVVAAKHTEKCVFAHMYHSAGYGENGRLADDANITRSVMNWFQERVYYDWNKPYGERCYLRDKDKNYLGQPQCGHYRMITTHTLTKVGCAINHCPVAVIPGEYDETNVELIFCFYDKGPRDHPYAAGEPCSGCSHFGNRYCRDGLCVAAETGDCKIVCKRCQQYVTFVPNYCGCDCNAGDGNDCSEPVQRRPTPESCGICEANGTPCQNGGTELPAQQCHCKCLPGFQGQFCEVTPEVQTNMKNAAVIKHFGQTWLYGFKIPVDRFAFLRKWPLQLRSTIAADIIRFCKSDSGDCGKNWKEIEAEDVQLIQGFPRVDEDGTLLLGIYVKRNGEYIDRGIVLAVIIQRTINDSNFLV